MPVETGRVLARRLGRLWPWAILALGLSTAAWEFVHFEDEPDGEFPAVLRPTFSPRPPKAYRLAEPGDTLDRVGLYASAGAAVVAAIGWWQSRRSGRGHALWPLALALGLTAGWHASTPWPTFDGWHGWNPRAVARPDAPPALRWAVLGVCGACLAWCAAWSLAALPRRAVLVRAARERGLVGLLALAATGVAWRLVGAPDVEPFGYWPRWAYALGMLAFGFALLRALPPQPAGRARLGWTLGAVLAWALLVKGGLWVVWLHRPIDRFKAVVPGRIYISGMPTPVGLAEAHRRHGFRTIINLFNEDGPQRSPLLPAELAFAREHGLTYVENPSDPIAAEAFLDRTLELARDPDAWPILVHCHGCMDRTPAWTGIYRFVVEGRPLDEILREIEQHRGLRPKASVTLLYNRVLRPRAPDRYDRDPTAALLSRCAAGTVDPYEQQLRAALEDQAGRIGRREGDDTRRP